MAAANIASWLTTAVGQTTVSKRAQRSAFQDKPCVKISCMYHFQLVTSGKGTCYLKCSNYSKELVSHLHYH